EAELDAALARQRLALRRVEDEVRAAVERHDALLELAELQRDRLLAGADDLLEIARVSYDAGEISLIELLDAAGAWRAALGARVELAADLVESEHELRRAIGGPISTGEEAP
ncbi:MAG TPA: TolC family protein, partial [Gemmatimonadota bacterium]|nr:TolC family protein [Gemmatimonadota bacterium]